MVPRSKTFTLFFILACGILAHSQNRIDLGAYPNLELLRSDRTTTKRLFSDETFAVRSDPRQDIFYRSSENIVVDYSSGKCTDAKIDESSWMFGFLGPDIWNVEAERVVSVSFEPKTNMHLSELGLDLGQFTKEQLHRLYPDRLIYFNKRDGVAIRTLGTLVVSVTFFPGKPHFGMLCQDRDIVRLFSLNKWRVIPEKKKDYCILINLPANVRDVSIDELGGNRFELVVTADDPENDVLSYLYAPSAGKIVGAGAKFIWDLSGVSAGVHEIKIAVDDGTGPAGIWLKKSVTIK